MSTKCNISHGENETKVQKTSVFFRDWSDIALNTKVDILPQLTQWDSLEPALHCEIALH